MIAEALAAYAAETTRLFEGRSNTIGASEIGQCARKTFFTKNESDWLIGAARDADHEDSWGAALRGRTFEDIVWVPALRRRFGDRLLFAGADQRTFASGYLSATPDGLLVDMAADILTPLGIPDIGDSLVVECKTVDPRTKLDEARPEHAYQAIVQMGLFRKLTPHRPDYALISYTDASFWNEITEFPVKFDSVIFASAEARATLIQTAQSPEEIAPEGWITGGGECRYCPFTSACGRMRHAVPTAAASEQPDPQFVAEIADLARTAKQQRRDAEAGTVRLREIEHEIRERLRSRGLRRVVGDGVSVTWSPVKGRPSYDMPAIREAAEKAGIDLSQFATVGDPTDRLTVTIRADASRAA
jgi:hypothetical protein